MTTQQTRPIPIAGLAHIGVRVHDLERSVQFYELLGFTKTAGPVGPEPVAILHHPSGLELNLILNAPEASAPNILMDVPESIQGSPISRCSAPISSRPRSGSPRPASR